MSRRRFRRSRDRLRRLARAAWARCRPRLNGAGAPVAYVNHVGGLDFANTAAMREVLVSRLVTGPSHAPDAMPAPRLRVGLNLASIALFLGYADVQTCRRADDARVRRGGRGHEAQDSRSVASPRRAAPTRQEADERAERVPRVAPTTKPFLRARVHDRNHGPCRNVRPTLGEIAQVLRGIATGPCLPWGYGRGGSRSTRSTYGELRIVDDQSLVGTALALPA